MSSSVPAASSRCCSDSPSRWRGPAPAAAAGGKSPDPGDKRGAKVVKAGWWWLANEPPPETGLLAAPQPPAPTTPKGSIPVGAAGGDPEKVSAIEVRLKAATGSTVRSFRMVLRESDEPGANANAESAKVLACPVTELFWADGSAAAWKDQPTYDCKDAAAKGKRTKKGLWRFDLTDIAAGWLEEGNTDSRSVVLVEDVDAPESFQLALEGPKDKGVGLALKATPPVSTGDDERADRRWRLRLRWLRRLRRRHEQRHGPRLRWRAVASAGRRSRPWVTAPFPRPGTRRRPPRVSPGAPSTRAHGGHPRLALRHPADRLPDGAAGARTGLPDHAGAGARRASGAGDRTARRQPCARPAPPVRPRRQERPMKRASCPPG